MAKLDDPVEVDGKPVLPKGTLVEGHLETTSGAPHDAPRRLTNDLRPDQVARWHGSTGPLRTLRNRKPVG